MSKLPYHRGRGSEVLPEGGGVGPMLVPKIEYCRREPADRAADHLVQVVAGHVQPRYLPTNDAGAMEEHRHATPVNGGFKYSQRQTTD